jgi:DNA-binding MarR family transcriptional regulator
MPTPMPARLSTSAAVDDLLLQRVSLLLATAGGMVTRICEGRFGITRREWRMLAFLVKEQGIPPSQLAQRAQLDRARTSRAITSLVGKQLVARTQKPGNRREAILTVTDKGREVYDTMLPLAVDINHRLAAALAPQDAERLDHMLDQLQACADDMLATADLPKANRHRPAVRPQVPDGRSGP